MVQQLSFDDVYGHLIRECLKNNRLAQKELYERLSSRMFSVCIRYIGDRELAKDILHDGFIVLFSKLDTFKGDGSFEGWARRIFINTALMHMRKGDVLRYSEDLEAKPVSEITISSSVIEELEAERRRIDGISEDSQNRITGRFLWNQYTTIATASRL